MLKRVKMQVQPMYHDKSILGLVIGFFATMLGSIILSITRTDVSFTVTLIAGLTTTVAALIKARRDWKEGRLKPFWSSWGKGKQRKG